MQALKTKEEIEQLFVDEYIKKYGELVTGKKTLKELAKESQATGTKVEKDLKEEQA